ncbi:hypothetical protein KSC_102880 [Ktedonobacter sp. SOSP1-52]|uniref:hypothetical protein n=1 Tax=Ktedonobacter sp. SOSP1-52 TaxID=2778366 RepID=UPI001915D07A|nr:hypothetical protein [Ktedonobacter sp. SOSP1-52]GHO71396.1 hypothetical protein KSC_102880 [Ktedonobacter sp. SOSP1-52]
MTSYVVALPSGQCWDLSWLDQQREQGILAWHEPVRQPRYAGWRVLRREDQTAGEVQGVVRELAMAGTYEVRVQQTEVQLIGINDRTEVTRYSPAEGEEVALSFALEPGESLLLWCRRRAGEQDAVVTALFFMARAESVARRRRLALCGTLVCPGGTPHVLCRCRVCKPEKGTSGDGGAESCKQGRAGNHACTSLRLLPSRIGCIEDLS